MSRWVTKRREELKKEGENDYYLIIAEVDASLISHNCDILDAYFMSMSDSAYIDEDRKNVLRLDYRTHLYVNQGYAVLFIATSDISDSSKLMNGMLNMTDVNTVENSKVVNLFRRVLKQRETFKDIGLFLSKIPVKSKELTEKRDKLVKTIAEAQKNECLDSQVELDTYKFIYDVFGIDRLKESVNNAMNIISDDMNEKSYSKLNFLSSITVPFVLVSQLFQIGLIRGESVIDFESHWLWGVIIVAVILITIVIWKFGDLRSFKKKISKKKNQKENE
jgi:hypothetical protein